ncbi:glycosyltransferase family 2 protein [Priestia flexa]|uniref:glycosyltransferase family 2 protein n=1 Tax=Priestia flexa TaxID=86664 RepID=UPI003FCF4459
MTNMHIFLCGHESPHVIQRLLAKLSDGASVTVIAKSEVLQLIPHHADTISLSSCIGSELNQRVQRLNEEHVLFLFKGDDVNLPLLKKQTLDKMKLYTYPLTDEELKLPLFFKSADLKLFPFSEIHAFPFVEAMFAYWVCTLPSDQCIPVDTKKAVKMGIQKETRLASAFLETSQLYQFTTEHKGSSPLSIMLAAYNAKPFIHTAVSSCFIQSVSFQKKQLFVVDDGSTDGTAEDLASLQSQLGFQLIQKENGGKARALNTLLPLVDTEFVLELDADDWLDSNALSVISNHLPSIPSDAAILYGNLRRWKETPHNGLKPMGVVHGRSIRSKNELLGYAFPMGPRIYRTSFLKAIGGFPVLSFLDGRMYEDVSVLNELMKRYSVCYRDFTVYNVRDHVKSITKKNHSNWSDFIKTLD